MPTSNTFSLPTAGKSFTLSLFDFNNSILATWSNFYGPNIPTSADVNVGGSAVTPYEGMLYRSSIFKAFYVYEPNQTKGSSLGGGFTRTGIGHRNFENIVSLVANTSYIEQGELVTTVGDSSANYRLYLRTTNSGAVVDVGIPPASSLTSGMFVTRQVPNTALQLNTVTQAELAPNIVYNSGFTSKGRMAIDSLAERSIVTTISGNLLTLDVGAASMHRVNVTSNINAISFSNTNTSMSWGVSVLFFANGNAYNFKTNSNVMYPNSNTPVTLTSTAGRFDAIAFISPAGSVPVFASIGGQGY